MKNSTHKGRCRTTERTFTKRNLEELVMSKDGKVRGAAFRTASGKLLNQPLNFLCPLECAQVNEKSDESTEP